MKKKNELVLEGQYKIEQVPALLALVVEKLKGLRGDDETPSGTNGELEQFGNIFQEKSPVKLIRAYSAVSSREDAYNKAVKGMKLTSAPKFEICGFSATAWKKDIVKQYHIVTKVADIAKLVAIKDKLNKYQTEEQQFNTDMGDIADILSL